MKVYILEKTTRKGDHGKTWIFSTQEKLDAFQAKFKLEDTAEAIYENWCVTVDPENYEH